jgi:glycosyltransferase involved in cell wall biosynthesis
MPVIWFNEVPGNWTYFKEMALRLSDTGLKIVVLSPRAKGNKPKEEIEGVTVYRYSSIYISQIPFLLINPISFLSVLKEIIKTEKHIDLVYDTTSGVLPSSLLIKLLFKLKGREIPLILHVHGELKDLKSKGLLSFLFELYLRMVASLCYALADKVLLAGEKILPRVLSLGAHPKKLKIVRVGLKYEDKLSNPRILSKEEKFRLRTSIGLHGKDFIVGYVGRLSPGKGLNTLFEAVARVKNIIPSLKVLLVGDGSEKSKLKMLASKLGIDDITIFLGYRDDVPSLLQIMDVFVNLSVSEAGISGSQIEAMRYGLPSIITPFTDALNNMRDAIVVPFNNAQAVSEALLLFYTNQCLRKRIGLNAAMKAQSLITSYSWSKYLSDVLKVFREIASDAK